MKFIAGLQRLAEECEFGTFLQDMLRDHLVVGIANDRIEEAVERNTDAIKQGETGQVVAAAKTVTGESVYRAGVRLPQQQHMGRLELLLLQQARS